MELFGALNISEAEERKFSCEVSFVGRLYNRFKFDELFSQEEEDQRAKKEVDMIMEQCFCKWDDTTSIYNKASNDLVKFLLRKEPVYDWDEYSLDSTFYVEGFKLARRLNYKERVAVLNTAAQKHQVYLYTDDKNIDKLINVEIKGTVNCMDEMPAAFYCSKINLNISSRSIESGIPQRIFDIMASGGFVLTNYQSELEEYFEIGKDLEVFHNLEELRHKIDYYLSHETERLRIALNGYQKVRDRYSYTVLASAWIDSILFEED